MRGKQGVAYISRRRFSVNDLVPSQSEACDASVPRGAKDRKRSELSGELSRAAKRARNRKCSRCSRGDKIDIGCNVKHWRVLSENIKRNELPIELRKNTAQ